MLCVWNLLGFTTLRLSFLKAGALLCPFLARPLRFHWIFQFIRCVFDLLYSATSGSIEQMPHYLRTLSSFFRLPILAFLC